MVAATGALRWKVPIPGGLATTVHRHRGAVLAVGSAGTAMAIDLATGSTIWTHEGVPPEASGPPQGDSALAGRRLFVPWRSGVVDAIDAGSGALLWRVRTGAPITTSAEIADDRVVVGTADGRLHWFDPDTGASRGAWACPGSPYGRLTEVEGGVLALVAGGGLNESNKLAGPHLLVLVESRSGAIRWRHHSEHQWGTMRPLVRGATVVAGARGGLVGLGVADGDVQWRYSIDDVPRGLSATEDTLFAGTQSGKVLSLPWPSP